MAVKVVFAVLAHGDARVVGQLTENLRANCRDADVVVFNGGTSDAWLADVDVEVVEQSRPLRWGYLAPFHYLTMQSLAGRDFDCLVTLDYDMMLLKKGFDAQLAGLLDNFGYIGTRFYAVDRGSVGDPDRFVLNWWDEHWSGLLKARQPYNVFNPAQIFRRDLVERFVADPAMPDILRAVELARVDCMEEIIYPTRAVAYGVAATSNPGSHALRTHEYDANELELLAADPNVFLVHKIVHDYQRAAIARLLEVGADAAAAAQRIALSAPISGVGRRKQLETALRQLRRDVVSVAIGP